MTSADFDTLAVQKRKIPPARRSVAGIYAFRGESSIPYESTLERDFLLLQEFNASVLDVITQPVEIPFSGRNGQHFTYTPDFLVVKRLGASHYNCYPKPLLIEVKPEAEWRAHWRKWLPKWKAARCYAVQQGWVFHIYDESRIRNQTLRNIRFLEPYKRMSFDPEDTQWVLNTLRAMGCASFQYLLTRHYMGIYQATGAAHLWHLLATRQIDCDMTLPLTDRAELWVLSND